MWLFAAAMLILITSIIFFWLVIVWIGTGQLIFPAHRRSNVSPTNYGLEAEAVTFTARDDITLRGWLIPSENSRAAIVFCHGYSGDCTPDLIYAPRFHQAGYTQLFFDFRGHGTSEGRFTSLVYFERRDLLAALDFLRSRGIQSVGLIGFSMGGAIALATTPSSTLVVGIVTDCAFAKLQHIVQHAALKRDIPKFLAGALGWCVVLCASLRLRANLFSADPIQWVGKIAPRPVLIMHAETDDAAPVREANLLFQAAKQPKELWIVPGATHRRIEDVAPVEYHKRIIDFFDSAFQKASNSHHANSGIPNNPR